MNNPFISSSIDPIKKLGSPQLLIQFIAQKFYRLLKALAANDGWKNNDQSLCVCVPKSHLTVTFQYKWFMKSSPIYWRIIIIIQRNGCFIQNPSMVYEIIPLQLGSITPYVHLAQPRFCFLLNWSQRYPG